MATSLMFSKSESLFISQLDIRKYIARHVSPISLPLSLDLFHSSPRCLISVSFPFCDISFRSAAPVSIRMANRLNCCWENITASFCSYT